MKKAFTIFIGFLHDFAAGCWAASVLAIYWLDRLSSQRPELKYALNGLERRFLWAGIASVAVVLIAGMGRTFTYAYIGSVYGEDAERLRRKMLIVKHLCCSWSSALASGGSMRWCFDEAGYIL